MFFAIFYKDQNQNPTGKNSTLDPKFWFSSILNFFSVGTLFSISTSISPYVSISISTLKTLVNVNEGSAKDGAMDIKDAKFRNSSHNVAIQGLEKELDDDLRSRLQ